MFENCVKLTLEVSINPFSKKAASFTYVRAFSPLNYTEMFGAFVQLLLFFKPIMQHVDDRIKLDFSEAGFFGGAII